MELGPLGSAGQAITELVLSSALILIVITGTGWVLRASWERGRCAYLTFEAGRARLSGAVFPTRQTARARWRLTEDARSVTAQGWCGDAEEKVSFRKLDERGGITPPMLLAFVAILIAIFGTWAVLHQWKHRARLQLQLDRCVRTAVTQFKRGGENLGRLNTAIRATRAALMASTLEPPVRAALQATLRAEVLAQQAILRAWEARRLSWRAGGGCPSAGWVPGEAGEFPVLRPPPDWIGEQALRWTGLGSAVFKLERRRRVSVAEVTPGGLDGNTDGTPAAGSASWPSLHARWTTDAGTSPSGGLPLERADRGGAGARGAASAGRIPKLPGDLR